MEVTQRVSEIGTSPGDDADLMRAVANGQMAALGHLVRRHQDVVRRLAYRFTGHWELADDIAQDTFLRVHAAATSYKPSAAFTTWLYRIVVNLCLDAKRRPRLAVLPDEFAPLSDGLRDPSEERELVGAVRDSVSALPDRQRLAVILHRFEGMSHSEIAAVTHWSESSVESVLVRAYATLRSRLREWAGT